VLLLQTMFYADELRKVEDYERKLPEVTDKELEMAVTLVRTLGNDGDLSQYRDVYREAVMEMIQAKLKGETITTKATPKPTMDLADALMASINQAKREKEAVTA